MGNVCLGGSGGTQVEEPRDRSVSWNAVYRSKTENAISLVRQSTAQSTSALSVMRNKDADLESVNQYQVSKILGKGSFGEVFLARANGQKYALKMLRKSALRRQRQGQFGSALDTVKAEIALMKKIRHPNCVQMFEVIDDEKADEVFIVLEFVDGGASQGMGRDGKLQVLKEDQIWSHVRHLVMGLEYLHMNGIVHRDIKPENLLVSKCARARARGAAERAAGLAPATGADDGQGNGTRSTLSAGRRGACSRSRTLARRSSRRHQTTCPRRRARPPSSPRRCAIAI